MKKKKNITIISIRIRIHEKPRREERSRPSRDAAGDPESESASSVQHAYVYCWCYVITRVGTAAAAAVAVTYTRWAKDFFATVVCIPAAAGRLVVVVIVNTPGALRPSIVDRYARVFLFCQRHCRPLHEKSIACSNTTGRFLNTVETFLSF